ncbi:MAG: Glycosyltransferase [Bacteroidetes bacterium]|nr:MAG: Glycosyltransferase [Bacteroidota bacterium]
MRILPYRIFRFCIRYIGRPLGYLFFPLTFFSFIILAWLSKLRKNKPFDIGLGPDPLINNVYHKRALREYGYRAETFVRFVYHITSEFDVRGDKRVGGWWIDFVDYYLFVRALFSYRCLYFYFNGGPLSRTMFARWEPKFYKIAGIKTVVMPYGSDVQDFTRTQNLIFVNAMRKDYPQHRFDRKKIARQIDRWTLKGDHIISGCDWVDYMYHWDTLMLAHFSIDMAQWAPETIPAEENRPLRILHAPNHRNIKGTKHFVKAVEELRQEGLHMEIVLLEKVPNSEVKRVMASCDIIADQLIVGGYAMFTLEGMSMGKPVLCYLRKDLEEMFIEAGLVAEGEIPLINCTPFNVKEVIRNLYFRRSELPEIGRRSRAFVEKHHSLASVGKVFDAINRGLGITPAGKGAQHGG